METAVLRRSFRPRTAGSKTWGKLPARAYATIGSATCCTQSRRLIFFRNRYRNRNQAAIPRRVDSDSDSDSDSEPIPVPTSQLRCKWQANAKRSHLRILHSGTNAHLTYCTLPCRVLVSFVGISGTHYTRYLTEWNYVRLANKFR